MEKQTKQSNDSLGILVGNFLAALILWATYNPLRPDGWQHLSYWLSVGIVFVFTFVVGTIRRPR